MCFGRYDSRTHQLADYHPSGTGTIWPGQDYSNPRIKDFVNGNNNSVVGSMYFKVIINVQTSILTKYSQGI